MAGEWKVYGDPERAPFYARLAMGQSGLRWSTSSNSFVAITSQAIGNFSLAATQEGSFEEYAVDRPAGISADVDVVVELIRGTLGSETAGDRRHAARLQTKGIAEVRSDLTAIAATLASISTIVGADIITAEVQLTRGEDQDEWCVVYKRNDVRLTSGIDSPPTLTVKDSSNATIFAAAMTLVSTGVYRYFADGAERVTAGEVVNGLIVAEVDEVEKSWPFTAGVSAVVEE